MQGEGYGEGPAGLQFPVPAVSAPVFSPLPTPLSHTPHTHAWKHACSTAHELILPRLAAWVGSFLLELFVQLSFK